MSELIQAVEDNDIRRVRNAIDAGVDVNFNIGTNGGNLNVGF